MVPPDVLADLRRHGIEPTGVAADVAGGSISRALRLDTSRGPLFLKLEGHGRADMLLAESESLDVLRRANAVAVPTVVRLGVAGRFAYLALEWIQFGAPTADAERRLGRQLACLHRVAAADFGWYRANYIGSTPQRNERSEDWPRFFRDSRLEPQLVLARRNGLPPEGVALGEQLLAQVDALLAGHAPQPSLLHGDLWAGNWAAARDGTPYVFDPAAYYGDREADIAMTRLFGGFGDPFHRAYEDAWPLPEGSAHRAELYNLYHVLNHFNLFGRAYLSHAVALLRTLAGRR